MKIISIFILTAMLSAAPTLLIAGQNVYATNSEETISQSQIARQLGVCISDENTIVSCNNWSDQDQTSFSGGNERVSQNQESRQQALCSSGGDSFFSCNNESDQDQTNFGDGTERVSQSQESRQEALCSSGGDTFFACNNQSDQDQTNNGGSAAVQSSSGDSWRNSYSGVSQSQESDQRSLCISGGDTAGSCNNFSEQSQVNYGSNAFAQFR